MYLGGYILYAFSMPDQKGFTIISVTGAHSGSGKTSLSALLLKHLIGFGAIKFTKTDLYTSVTDDASLILEQDKDTEVLFRAGARRVVWIQCPVMNLEGALDIALNKMEGLEGVVIEGNSPSEFAAPGLIIFVAPPDGRMKSSAVTVCRKADIIVINAEPPCQCPDELSYVIKKDAAVFTVDLLNQTGEIDKFLIHVKEYMRLFASSRNSRRSPDPPRRK